MVFLNDSSDGLVFVELGARNDTHAIGAATIPGRAGMSARLRMPFWLIPGDLALAAPVLARTSPGTLQKMASEQPTEDLSLAGWDRNPRPAACSLCSGREVGVSIFRNSDHSFLLPTPGVPPNNTTLVNLNSLQVEFPILEYRLFRNFSVNQSSGLMLQPYVGFDVRLRFQSSRRQVHQSRCAHRYD